VTRAFSILVQVLHSASCNGDIVGREHFHGYECWTLTFIFGLCSAVYYVSISAVTIIDIDIDIAIYYRYRSLSISRYMVVSRPRFSLWQFDAFNRCANCTSIRFLIKIRRLILMQILGSAHLRRFVCHGRQRLGVKLTQSLCCPLLALIPRHCI